MMTPLAIVSTRKNDVLTERLRVRIDSADLLMGLMPDIMIAYAHEDPDEVIIRILRPTRE